MDGVRSPGTWTQGDRERAYTALCEAVTAAGQAGEPLFLARLALLLAEELGDATAFARCLAEASVPNTGAEVVEPTTDATTAGATAGAASGATSPKPGRTP